MPVTAAAALNALGNVAQLSLNATPTANAPLVALTLDCSLSRHAYQHIDGANAKPLNSILFFSMGAVDVLTDLASIGTELVTRLDGLLRQAPLQRDIIAAGMIRALGGPGAAAFGGAAPNRLDVILGGTLFGDYTATSGRTYRVDNTGMNPTRRPNHCYPIAGPELWAAVSQTAFAAAAALRRLELDMRRYPKHEKPGFIAEKWKSLQYAGAGNATFGAISGARTQIRAASALEQTKLGEVSNVPWLIEQVVALK